MNKSEDVENAVFDLGEPAQAKPGSSNLLPATPPTRQKVEFKEIIFSLFARFKSASLFLGNLIQAKAVASLTLAAAARAENWPAWRGPITTA